VVRAAAAQGAVELLDVSQVHVDGTTYGTPGADHPAGLRFVEKLVDATGVVTILVVTVRRSSAHAQLAHQRVVLSPPCSPPEPGEASTSDALAERSTISATGALAPHDLNKDGRIDDVCVCVCVRARVCV